MVEPQPGWAPVGPFPPALDPALRGLLRPAAWGLLLVLADLFLVPGTAQLDVLPDVLGWALLAVAGLRAASSAVPVLPRTVLVAASCVATVTSLVSALSLLGVLPRPDGAPTVAGALTVQARVGLWGEPGGWPAGWGQEAATDVATVAALLACGALLAVVTAVVTAAAHPSARGWRGLARLWPVAVTPFAVLVLAAPHVEGGPLGVVLLVLGVLGVLTAFVVLLVADVRLFGLLRAVPR